MKKIGYIFLCMCAPCWVLAAQNWKAVLRYDKQQAKARLAERLQKYAQEDSRAALFAGKAPSTPQQLAFAKYLAKELKHMGAANVKVSKTAIVTAEIPSTTTQPSPVLALIAHLDIPPQAQPQEPQLRAKYTGGNVTLDKKNNLYLTEENSPQLRRAHGHDLVVSNGAAAFGAASKAGLTILLEAADYLLAEPSLQHGPIKLVLLPDSSSHAGARALDTASLAATYAYVLDGSDMGEIATGNFAGRSFTALFEGRRDVPLGQAVSLSFSDNLLMASDFHTLLPRHLRPETTSGMQGYIAVDNIVTQGNRSLVTGHLRAFTQEKLQALSQQVSQAFNTVKAMNPKSVKTELTFQNEFTNTQGQIPPLLLQSFQQAFKQEDIHPKLISVRNYTDSAVLTQKGLPAVGIFTGVFHGGEPLEYADVEVMEASLRGLLSWLLTDTLTPKQ